VHGFLDNLAQVYEEADDESADSEVFLQAVRVATGGDAVTAAALARMVQANESLREALPADVDDGRPGSLSRRLADALKKREQTRYGEQGLRVERAGKGQGGRVLWRIAGDG
jgi:hypothetical protein